MEIKVISTLLITVFSMMLSTSAQALICSGKMDNVTILGNGEVLLSVTIDTNTNYYRRICDLDEEDRGVSVTTCAIWTSTAQRLLDQDKDIRVGYNNTGSYSTCEQLLSSGQLPAPSSVRVYRSASNNTGDPGSNTGGGNTSTPVTTPSGLTTVSVTATNASAFVSWTDGGSQNWLEIRDPSGTLIHDFTLGSTTEKDVTGLSPSTTYQAKLYIEGEPNYPNVTFSFSTL